MFSTHCQRVFPLPPLIIISNILKNKNFYWSCYSLQYIFLILILSLKNTISVSFPFSATYPLWHCCHTFHLSICYNHSVHWYFYDFKQLSFRSTKRKRKHFILPSFIPFLMFSLSLCRSKFLTYIICFLPEGNSFNSCCQKVY